MNNNGKKFVRNVVHHYINPTTGEMEEKRFDDGPYEEVQAKIEDFMKELESSKEEQRSNDDNTIV